jgi:Protein of unknown function (DUF4241)
LRLANLEGAFVNDQEITSSEGSAILKLQDLGKLILPSGRIVACDPFVFPETEPFPISVQPGQYPVTISVAQMKHHYQRVAYALLRFSDCAVVRWEMALLPEQDLNTLEEDQFFGYGVDSGTGCFMDAEIGRVLAERMWENDDWDSDLMEEMEKSYVHTWSWLNACIDPATGANLIAFSSGWGDGGYPSYWGYDKDENVVALVTDFCL